MASSQKKALKQVSELVVVVVNLDGHCSHDLCMCTAFARNRVLWAARQTSLPKGLQERV